MRELRIAWRKPAMASVVLVDSSGGTIAASSLARGEQGQRRVTF
jgi:hypothetical protein